MWFSQVKPRVLRLAFPFPRGFGGLRGARRWEGTRRGLLPWEEAPSTSPGPRPGGLGRGQEGPGGRGEEGFPPCGPPAKAVLPRRPRRWDRPGWPGRSPVAPALPKGGREAKRVGGRPGRRRGGESPEAPREGPRGAGGARPGALRREGGTQAPRQDHYPPPRVKEKVPGAFRPRGEGVHRST